MTDELRIACERLLRNKQRSEWYKKYYLASDPPCPIEDPYPSGMWEPTESYDRILVSDAYLKEHTKDFK